MPGNPAFQINAFQNNAFQTGVLLVAGDYALASPSFATPPLVETYEFTAPAFVLGSPSIASPTLHVTSLVITIPPYSLGSPAFAAPSVRQLQRLSAAAYALASPAFDFAHFGQTQHLGVNSWAVGSPLFDAPGPIHDGYSLHATPFAVGGLSWAAVGPVVVDVVFALHDYVLGSPGFAYPRLTATIPAHWYYPPDYLTQVEQATNILIGTLDHLQAAIPNVVNAQTNTARALIYNMRANADAELRGTTLGTDLQAVYDAADAAGASYTGLDATRAYLVAQAGGTPNAMTALVIGCALNMTLAAECNAIVRMTFTNRDDVAAMLAHVSDMFEQAKQVAALSDDPAIYESVIALGGATASYLARVQLQLPRFIAFDAKAAFPSLYLAQRIYADPTRWQEIEAENGVVNPAFCPAQLRVLSNVGH